MAIYNIMLCFQWVCMLISTVFSFRTANSINTPKYMKTFFVYPLIAFLLCSIYNLKFFMLNFPFELITYINKLSYIFHYLFSSYFIFISIENKEIKRIFIPLFCLALLLLLISIRHSIHSTLSNNSSAFTNLALVIYCVI